VTALQDAMRGQAEKGAAIAARLQAFSAEAAAADEQAAALANAAEAARVEAATARARAEGVCERADGTAALRAYADQLRPMLEAKAERRLRARARGGAGGEEPSAEALRAEVDRGLADNTRAEELMRNRERLQGKIAAAEQAANGDKGKLLDEEAALRATVAQKSKCVARRRGAGRRGRSRISHARAWPAARSPACCALLSRAARPWPRL